MALTTRQTSLLVQQDWTKIYQTFREADFQSFDFETIRKSMIEYLRTYYPEDYNDFIESSEYIALIDLIAFLGQSLAFRTDLNARENFLDTAERRDSILKLAKLVSYNPKRSTPASGLLKIDSISTTEAVYDSTGTNVSNLVVSWNDTTNENWLEQFTAVLNAALVSTQAIGKPGASQTLNGIKTDEYTLDILSGIAPVYPYTATIAGVQYPFEIVSATTASKSYIYEKDPKPIGAFNFLYRNDNQGNGSNNTGYFLYFKQGNLKNIDFSIAESLPNRIVNINFDNINNTDVWLYSLNTSGLVSSMWTQVPAVNGLNVIYNNTSDRDLYSVNTRANDQVDLVFGDGSFTNIPIGNYRLYYRVSNNLTYKITPDEMAAISITVPYRGRTGRTETLTIRASLQYTVTNASSRETLNEIRTKAPQQYYTQNRMITGEDYNILPYTTFNNILKVKALNRSSSGVSRYLDVIDATGKYSSTNIFSQDGLLYKDSATTTLSFQFTSSTEVNYIIQNLIKPLITTIPARHLYYETATRFSVSATWTKLTSNSGRSTGTFTATNYSKLKQGALIKFVAPANKYFDAQNQLQVGTPSTEYQKTILWASIISYEDNPGVDSVATLSVIVPTGAILSQVIPVFANNWPAALTTAISNNILSYKTFGIRYDISGSTPEWKIIDENNLSDADFDITTAGTSADSSWFIKLNYANQEYKVAGRGVDYYFQSVRETRFYFDPDVKVYDSKTATTKLDQIKILRTNTKPDSADSLYYSQSYRVWNRVVEADGYEDNRRILITFPDENLDSVPDNPDQFVDLVAPTVNTNSKYVFFVQTVDQFNFIKYEPVSAGVVVTTYPTESQVAAKASLYPVGTVFYAYNNAPFSNKFLQLSSDYTLVERTDYHVSIGRQELLFQYTHNSPNNRRVDPSPNNLIDLYILTKEYSDQYYAYITDTSNKVKEPVAPTDEELKIEFGEIENYKTISDSIIYNSARFKPLFGAKADPSLRATFKVVKNPTINISDNDVKSQVVAAINTYFDINNWDFGETFYFSELSAYLHTTLSPNVSSVIIVPSDGQFGSLFQINAEPNEIVVSAATVDNVQIISAITAGQLNTVIV